VNRRPRDDAELRSAAGDTCLGPRIASVYADFRRSQLGPGPVRAQFSDWEVTGSVLDSRNRPRWLPALLDLLPESIALMPRLRLLARLFMMVRLLVLRGTLVLTANSSVPKASTALDFRCSHFDLAELEDLLLGRVGG
jgi:hypothetical protein